MQSRRIYYDEDSKLNFTSDDMLGTEPLNSIDSPTKSFLLRKQRTLANQEDGRATDQKMVKPKVPSKIDMRITQSLNGQVESNELAKTHVEGFRKAAYDLESFIEQ